MVDDHTDRLSLEINKPKHTHRCQRDSHTGCISDTLHQLIKRDSAAFEYGIDRHDCKEQGDEETNYFIFVLLKEFFSIHTMSFYHSMIVYTT